MARPKTLPFAAWAQRAQADMETLEHYRVFQKLQAVILSGSLPLSTVAQGMGVAPQTVWRWVKAYGENGMAGLLPKTRAPRKTKLNMPQKLCIKAWLHTQTNAVGEPTQWTLEKLQRAILKEYGIRLGITTLWTWLRQETKQKEEMDKKILCSL